MDMPHLRAVFHSLGRTPTERPKYRNATRIRSIAGYRPLPDTQDEMTNAHRESDPALLQLSGAAERRTSIRFPLQLELRFRNEEKSALWRAGRTVNISSSGLLFVADAELNPGSRVCLSVDWPAILDKKAALRLIIHGRVIRVFEDRVAVAVQRSEFRTAGTVVS